MNEMLNREFGLQNNMDPTGKKWVAVKANSEQGLWRVGVQKDKTVSFPETIESSLKGLFTAADKANAQIKNFLTQLWDKSDEAIRVSKSKGNYKDA